MRSPLTCPLPTDRRPGSSGCGRPVNILASRVPVLTEREVPVYFLTGRKVPGYMPTGRTVGYNASCYHRRPSFGAKRPCTAQSKQLLSHRTADFNCHSCPPAACASEMHAENHMWRRSDSQTGIETDRQAGRQADRQAGMQTDRQADR